MTTLILNEFETVTQEGYNRQWFTLNGTDKYGLVYFDSEQFALTSANQILDCDGCPITEGDYITKAVRNAIRGIL